jgi:hypothetical protein
VSLNKTITANFSMVMDPLTITTNFTLNKVQQLSRTCNLLGITASFKPTNALVEGKTYTATTTAAKNAGYL